MKRSLSSLRNKQNLIYDSFGRRHDYLRISLTERCNLRCKYCMPAEGISLTNKDQLLQETELKRLTDVFVKLGGVKKVRLTGGEPSIDQKLLPILEHLNQLRAYGLETVAMTTNGLTLKRQSHKLKQSGLDAINISLDTLKPDKFETITRRKGWPLVMEGLMQALETKFTKIKLNCVVMRNFNDDELADFCQLAIEHPLDVRFIEFMPFFGNKWHLNTLVTFDEMLAKIKGKFPNFERATQLEDPNDTSKIFRSPKMLGSVGFITAMTKNFCSSCNRLRLTADGQLKVCLFDRQETSIRDLLRNGASDQEIMATTRAALQGKKKQHAGFSILSKDVHRPMIKIEPASDTTNQVRKTHSKDGVNFSHLSKQAEARMVNIGNKCPMRRIAIASGQIFVGRPILNAIRQQALSKGEIISVSKIAGLMGAKLTSNLIPMCHQVPLDHVSVDIRECTETDSLMVEARVEATHKTGVEMECLTAVSVTLLTIYDMCKSANKSMVISNIRLVSKTKETC